MKTQKKPTVSHLRPWDWEDNEYIKTTTKNAMLDDYIELLAMDLEDSIKLQIDLFRQPREMVGDPIALNAARCRSIRYAIRDMKHLLAAFQSYIEQCELKGELK